MGLLKKSSTYVGKADQRGQTAVDWLMDVVTRMARLAFLKSATLDLTSYDSKDREPVWGAASVSVTTDASGLATVTFPVAFPSAVIAVVVTAQMTSVAAVALSLSTPPTTTAFTVEGPALTTFTVHYIAVGV